MHSYIQLSGYIWTVAHLIIIWRIFGNLILLSNVAWYTRSFYTCAFRYHFISSRRLDIKVRFIESIWLVLNFHSSSWRNWWRFWKFALAIRWSCRFGSQLIHEIRKDSLSSALELAVRINGLGIASVYYHYGGEESCTVWILASDIFLSWHFNFIWWDTLLGRETLLGFLFRNIIYHQLIARILWRAFPH